ncbi:MAG: ABC transporter permease [Thermodesulfobacteriota bacterium]
MQYAITFLVRRLGQGIIIVLIVMIVVFCLLRVIPGDPALLIAGAMAPEERKAEVAKELGLTDPIPIQFFRYFMDVIQGDFGKSYIRTKGGSTSAGSASSLINRGTRADPIELILERLPKTLILAGVTLMMSVSISLVLGVWAGLNQGRWPDKVILYFTSTSVSLPNFWLALIFAMIFSLWLGLLPAVGYKGPIYAIMPAMVLSAEMVPFLTRGLSVAVSASIRERYVSVGFLRGLSRRSIIFGHVLKNASIPVLNLLGIQLGTLLGGVMIVEFVFDYPGVGHLALHSVFDRDFPVVQAIVVLTSAVFVIINILVDLLSSYIDPRLEY